MTELKNDLILLFKDNLINFASEIIGTILILMVFFIFYRIMRKIVLRCLSKSSLDESVIKFISSIMNIAWLIVAGLVILSVLNFPVSSIVTIFTAIAVGIGISFKESLGNLGAGVILLWSKQFKTGDYISCLNIEGVVHGMTAFTVMLKTTDNKIITIPNSKLINDTIINFSAQQTRRMNIELTLPYGVDISKTKAILSEILEKDERILKDPKYTLGVRNLTDKGMEIIVAPWVSTEIYWEVYYDLMEEIIKKLGENNIKSPCTQVEIINKKKHSF